MKEDNDKLYCRYCDEFVLIKDCDWFPETNSNNGVVIKLRCPKCKKII